MSYAIGLDIGSTYTKGLILDGSGRVVGRAMRQSGGQLREAATAVMNDTIGAAGLTRGDVGYCITTGFGRHQLPDRDIQVTDLTAAARGAAFLFSGTRTVLDVGGQTVKVSRVDERRKVTSFRLNDKCASGTGMFLEKTVRYMGFKTEDIEGLLNRAKEAASVSGVCTVFAESEVINHLSNGVPPENIMLGATMSLTERSVQLLKRARFEREVTVVGGILRWGRIATAIREALGTEVNVPEGDLPQFVGALGCAVLGQLRLGIARSASAA